MMSSSVFCVPNSDATKNPCAKKKRNLPGTPDPDAEVVALSPESLMATNRFVCEICNKGFQREQNLQLHRRGHNLPWKLKQRANKDQIKKKVYVCPEKSCVHHDPARALGDLGFANDSHLGFRTMEFGVAEGGNSILGEDRHQKPRLPLWLNHIDHNSNLFGASGCYALKEDQVIHRNEGDTNNNSNIINHQKTSSPAPMSATSLLQKASQMGSTTSNSSFFGNTVGVLNSSSPSNSSTTNVTLPFRAQNNRSELYQASGKQRPENIAAKGGRDGMMSFGSVNNNNFDSQALFQTPGGQGLHSGLHGMGHSQTRDFLGVSAGDGGDGEPFLPQELANFASMRSAMAMGLSHFTS